MLFEILHFDFYKIPRNEIATLTVEVNKRQRGGEVTSMRKLLYDNANRPPRDLFDAGINERLKSFSKIIENLIADVSNVAPRHLFETIISKGWLLNYIMESDEKITLTQVLSTLFDFIKEESSRNPQLTLPGLISTLDLMGKGGLSLSMSNVSGSDRGVNLLPPHVCKGMKFQHVFVAGVNASSLEKETKPGVGFIFPHTVFSPLSPANGEEELRRSLYEAVSTAEKHVQISYVKYKADGSKSKPSMFIAEILETHQLATERIEPAEKDLPL